MLCPALTHRPDPALDFPAQRLAEQVEEAGDAGKAGDAFGHQGVDLVGLETVARQDVVGKPLIRVCFNLGAYVDIG